MTSLKFEVRSYSQWGVVLFSVLTRAQIDQRLSNCYSVLYLNPGCLTGTLQSSKNDADESAERLILQNHLSAIVAQGMQSLSKLEHVTGLVSNSAFVRVDQAVEFHNVLLNMPRAKQPSPLMSDAEKKQWIIEAEYDWIMRQKYPGQFTATGTGIVLRCYINEARMEMRYDLLSRCCITHECILIKLYLIAFAVVSYLDHKRSRHAFVSGIAEHTDSDHVCRSHRSFDREAAQQEDRTELDTKRLAYGKPILHTSLSFLPACLTCSYIPYITLIP